MDHPPAITAVETVSEARPARETRPAAPATRSWFAALRSRLVGGLVFALPIVIPFWIVYWLLWTLRLYRLDPLAGFVDRLHAWISNSPALHSLALPEWWYNIASPVLALLLALAILSILALLFRSWVDRTIDWFLRRVPVVATIYRALRNVFDSLGSQFQGGAGFQRVVLVDYPHPGMRSLGLVTNSLRDTATGRTILTVCVRTGVMPPTGFAFSVPEDSVTNYSLVEKCFRGPDVPTLGDLDVPPLFRLLDHRQCPSRRAGGEHS